MLKHLFWKEARETLWKLGFCLAASWVFTVMLFRVRLFTDFASCAIVSFAQLLVVPLVYALDLYAGEMSNRTIHLLFKLPVARWKIFLAKVLTAMGCMALIFLGTGLLMELVAHGRETDPGMLFKTNALFGVCAILLVAWFSAFGSQSRSEAGSLAALFGVMTGWGIVWLWAGLCGVGWALHGVPYVLIPWAIGVHLPWLEAGWFWFAQGLILASVLGAACYRYVKIRRVL